MPNKLKIKNFKLKIAMVVSRLFDPAILIPLLLTVAAGWSVANGLRWRFIVILILIDGIIPFLYFVHLLKTGEISDWDTTKRTQRFRLYWFTIAVHAIGVIFAWLLGKIILAKILFVFWTMAVAYSLITLFWKISLHAGVAAAAATFAVLVFGPQFIWLYSLPIVIGWARVVLKKHTLAQVVIGGLLAPLILFSLFQLLKIDRWEAQRPSQTNLYVR